MQYVMLRGRSLNKRVNYDVILLKYTVLYYIIYVYGVFGGELYATFYL